jgi:hypothetical protein
VKKRGNGWILAGVVVTCFGIFIAFAATATTSVDAYGRSVQGGPTVATFLVIILGIVLAGIGFCIRILGAVEKR